MNNGNISPISGFLCGTAGRLGLLDWVHKLLHFWYYKKKQNNAGCRGCIAKYINLYSQTSGGNKKKT